MGWGQVLSEFFDPAFVRVENRAVGGRSSKSFRNEFWGEILPCVRKGDFVFIGFGHNDSKPDAERRTEPYSTFQEQLILYIKEVRAVGAYPLLLTPVQRNYWEDENAMKPFLGDYPSAILEVGKLLDVPVVDLNAKTKLRFEEMGRESMDQIYLILGPGEYSNYPAGVRDNTHLRANGAREVCFMIGRELARTRHPLAVYLDDESFVARGVGR